MWNSITEIRTVGGFMRGSLKYLGLITQIGLNIVVSVLLGAVIGVFLDNRLGTQVIFTLLFILLGGAAGLYSSYRMLIKISMDDLDK